MKSPKPNGSEDFRIYLKGELDRRLSANSRYSLRAFARSLALSHASLSHLISGRRPLSDKMIHRLGLKLGLTASQVSNFIAAEPLNPPNPMDARDLAKEDPTFT